MTQPVDLAEAHVGMCWKLPPTRSPGRHLHVAAEDDGRDQLPAQYRGDAVDLGSAGAG